MHSKKSWGNGNATDTKQIHESAAIYIFEKEEGIPFSNNYFENWHVNMHQILLVVIFLSVSRTINLRPMFLECSSLLNTSHCCLFIIYQKWSTLKLVRTQSLKHITVVHTFDTMVWFQLLNIADLWSDSCSVQISDASRMVKAALLTTNEINMLDVLNFWLILKITFWQIWHYIFEVQSIYILKTTWPYMCLSSSLHTHCSLWNIEACNEPKFSSNKIY